MQVILIYIISWLHSPKFLQVLLLKCIVHPEIKHYLHVLGGHWRKSERENRAIIRMSNNRLSKPKVLVGRGCCVYVCTCVSASWWFKSKSYQMAYRRHLREKMEEKHDLNLIHVGNYQKKIKNLKTLIHQESIWYWKERYFLLHTFTNNQFKYESLPLLIKKRMEKKTFYKEKKINFKVGVNIDTL